MPLHRSLVFWFGFLVLGFLVWVWQDSRTSYSSYRWYSGSYRSMCLVSNQRSEIVVNWSRIHPDENPGDDFRLVTPGLRGGASRNFLGALADQEPAPWFPRPGFKHSTHERDLVVGSRGGRVMAVGEWWGVAHWVLIAGYLPLWLGVAMWRARRIGRGRRKILGRAGSGYVRVVVR